MAPDGAPTVLVVEDDGDTRDALAALLRREGYRVVLAPDGEAALDILRRPPLPELVLLDMLMPVLDGWHFLGRLRRAGLAESVPVVVTTGTILTREWAASHGCRGFLRKPVEPDALLAEVRRCLDGAGAPLPCGA